MNNRFSHNIKWGSKIAPETNRELHYHETDPLRDALLFDLAYWSTCIALGTIIAMVFQ
jgi:hypothetical protein